MTKSQLKGKLISKLKKGTGGYAGRGLRGMYAEDIDIKSAVEWLKFELKDRELLHFVIENLINEAFADVI